MIRYLVVLILAMIGALAMGCSTDDDDSSVFAPGASKPVFQVTAYGANLTDEKADDDAFGSCVTAAVGASGICKIGTGQLTLTKSPVVLRRLSSSGPNIDLKGATIEGSGSGTVIKGISPEGFDVLNLNAVSNLTIKNLVVTAVKTTASTHHGVNGISMTNGTSNVTVDGVTVRGLPFVAKTSYIDGGKAFTVQQGAEGSQGSTNVKVQNSQAIDCPYGFGLDADPNLAKLPGKIDVVGNTFTNALAGVAVSFTSKKTGGTDVPGFALTVKSNVMTNVKYAFLLGRSPGVLVQGNTVTTSIVPSYPDQTGFDGYAAVVLGVKGATIKQNTIKYPARTLRAFLLVGGTSNAAWTEATTFSGNSLQGTASFGFEMRASQGVSVRKCAFTLNAFKTATTPYDSALKASSLQNTFR